MVVLNVRHAEKFCTAGTSFTKNLSMNLGLSSFLSEKFTLIPYHKILTLNLRYFMKLAPCNFVLM